MKRRPDGPASWRFVQVRGDPFGFVGVRGGSLGFVAVRSAPFRFQPDRNCLILSPTYENIIGTYG